MVREIDSENSSRSQNSVVCSQPLEYKVKSESEQEEDSNPRGCQLTTDGLTGDG